MYLLFDLPFYFKRCPILFFQSYKAVIGEHLIRVSYDQLRIARYAVYVVPYFIKIKYVFRSINNFVIYTHIILRVVDIILITMINANMMDE